MALYEYNANKYKVAPVMMAVPCCGGGPGASVNCDRERPRLGQTAEAPEDPQSPSAPNPRSRERLQWAVADVQGVHMQVAPRTARGPVRFFPGISGPEPRPRF